MKSWIPLKSSVSLVDSGDLDDYAFGPAEEHFSPAVEQYFSSRMHCGLGIYGWMIESLLGVQIVGGKNCSVFFLVSEGSCSEPLECVWHVI